MQSRVCEILLLPFASLIFLQNGLDLCGGVTGSKIACSSCWKRGLWVMLRFLLRNLHFFW